MEKVHNDVFFYIKKEFDSFSYKNKKKKSCYILTRGRRGLNYGKKWFFALPHNVFFKRHPGKK